MKKLVFLSIIVGMNISALPGQDISESDKALIDDFINSTIIIKKERIESEALAKVFNGSFYFATPTYNRDGGTSSCEKYSLVVTDGKIAELEQVTETKALAQLLSLVRKDFTMKSEADAVIFEAALDKLYPLEWSDEPSNKKHFIKDGRWLFVRGKFFDSQKAFIVTLDQNSGISQIDYDLEAVKGQ